jgi:hypothetical protein
MAGAFGVFSRRAFGHESARWPPNTPGDSQPISFGLRAAKGEADVAGNPARAIQRPCPELTWLADRPARGQEELVTRESQRGEHRQILPRHQPGLSPRARAGGIDLSR